LNDYYGRRKLDVVLTNVSLLFFSWESSQIRVNDTPSDQK
jgi:hypothetical protein